MTIRELASPEIVVRVVMWVVSGTQAAVEEVNQISNSPLPKSRLGRQYQGAHGTKPIRVAPRLGSWIIWSADLVLTLVPTVLCQSPPNPLVFLPQRLWAELGTKKNLMANAFGVAAARAE